MIFDKSKNKIIIWGLRKKWHTHRFIHKAFYENAKKLGYKTIWVEDEKKNQKYIQSGDLIIASEVQGKMVLEKFSIEDYNIPIRDDIKYCLHNFKNIFKDRLNHNNYINLGVYTKEAESSDIKIDTARYFSTKTNTLYQPWGTDLLPHEFKKPTYNNNKFVFWIGSIWDNKLNQGNLLSIRKLRIVLQKHSVYFLSLRFIPDWLNIFFIRCSRMAPAIAGQYQVDINYLPCRMFKNISYGQLGITNVKKFKDILKESFIYGNTIEELIDNSINLSEKEYIGLIKQQQMSIEKYTYKNSIENIIHFLFSKPC